MTHHSQKSSTTQHQFIIVATTSGYALGVQSLKPGGQLTIENADSLIAKFQNNHSPFSSHKTEEGALFCQVASGCATGAYPFDLVEASATPSSFPYVVHVMNTGAATALGRVVNAKLRMVLTVPGTQGQSININFTKEGFQAAVDLEIIQTSMALTHQIPNNQQNLDYQITPNQLPTLVTFKVSKPVEQGQLKQPLPRLEVVGSDEGDLDIVPPPD